MASLSRRVARALLSPASQDLLAAIRWGHDDRIWQLLVERSSRGRVLPKTLHTRTDLPFSGVEAHRLRSALAPHLLAPSRRFRQVERVSLLETSGYITPDGGWLIAGATSLVDSCLVDSDYARKPSFRRYLQMRLRPGRSIRQLPRVVHLRDWSESNYWHFLNDIIGGRLRLALKSGVGPDTPLLLGRRAVEQPFVQEILARSGLARMKLIVQDDELLRFRDILYFQTPRHSLDSVNFFVDWLNAPAARTSATKRVLLARGGRAGRPMTNFAEVEAVCRQNGFETIHPDTLSLREQIELFSQVRYLVAEHGAGLTNMAFRRRAPLTVLEIFPAWAYTHPGGLVGPPPPHYFWLAQALGFQYDAIAGGAMDAGHPGMSFCVDPVLLEQRLAAALGATPIRDHVR